jgi:hypothetical protein
MEHIIKTIKKDDSLFRHTALGKREMIFDGLSGTKPSIVTINVNEDGVCTFHASTWNVKILDIVILYINDEKKYSVLMAITDDSLTFKVFGRPGEAKSYAKQYSDLL